MKMKCDSTSSARLMTWILPFASLHTIWLEILRELISFLWNMKQNAMKSSLYSALWSHRANIRTTQSRANQPNKFYKLLFLEFYSFYELKLVCCRYLWRHEGKQTERQISLPVLSQFRHSEPPGSRDKRNISNTNIEWSKCQQSKARWNWVNKQQPSGVSEQERGGQGHDVVQETGDE